MIKSSVAYDYIIPKYIFNDAGLIGYDGWKTENPVLALSSSEGRAGNIIDPI